MRAGWTAITRANERKLSDSFIYVIAKSLGHLSATMSQDMKISRRLVQRSTLPTIWARLARLRQSFQSPFDFIPGSLPK